MTFVRSSLALRATTALVVLFCATHVAAYIQATDFPNELQGGHPDRQSHRLDALYLKYSSSVLWGTPRRVTGCTPESIAENHCSAVVEVDGRYYEPLVEYSDAEDCLDAGYFWCPGVTTCWYQVVSEEVESEPSFCPLEGGQSESYCEAAGCVWDENEEWRCRKPAAANRGEVEPLQIPYYWGSVKCFFILSPVLTADVGHYECEDEGMVWLEFPTWNCWDRSDACLKN